MVELNEVNFRRVALAFLLCFPKVNTITVSKKSEGWFFLQLWKNVRLIKINNEWGNQQQTYSGSVFRRCGAQDSPIRFIRNRMNKGLVDQIDLEFLGYYCNQRQIDNYKLDRKCIKLNQRQVVVNTFTKLKEHFYPLFHNSNIRNISFENYGKIIFHNVNGCDFCLNMRGSGFRTTARYSISI